MKTCSLKFVCLWLPMLWGSLSADAAIRYVNASRPDDSGNGLSWAAAEKTLQAALVAAASGDQIWVAAGTYKPDQGGGQVPGDSAATFSMKNGVLIYGGFAGTETLLSQRNPATNVTILSGDKNGDDFLVACTTDTDCNAMGGLGSLCADGTCILYANRSNNSWHVVTAPTGVSSTSVLDGFTIQGGNASGPGVDSRGGGVRVLGTASPTIANCTIIRSSANAFGGGVYTESTGVPSFKNCTFEFNLGAFYRLGGGVIVSRCRFNHNRVVLTMTSGGTSVVTHCVFNSNAGGLSLSSTNGSIWNSEFINNQGVSMLCQSATGNVRNCSFSLNSGGGILVTGASSNLTVDNSILWDDGGTSEIQVLAGTAFVSESIVEGGWSGSGSNNLDADPLFVDMDGADNAFGTLDDSLRISSGSPAIDAGANSSLPNDISDLDSDGDLSEQIPFDLAGNARRVDDPSVSDTGSGTPPIVDRGAYEYRPPLFVDDSATGANNGTNWTNAFTKLQDALGTAFPGDQMWVAAGTYEPDEGVGITLGDRTATFQLENGVALYGGFAGNETSLDQRNPAINETTLSGDLSGNDMPNFANYAENSYHVVTGSGTAATALLDGFTVSGGNANGMVDATAHGGGYFSSAGNATLRSCRFISNRTNALGGAVDLRSGSSSDVIDCVFERNEAFQGGGLSGHFSANGRLTNCTFQSNTATNGGSGAAFQTGTWAITDTMFLDNLANSYGGGVALTDVSLATFVNCSFLGNQAATGGGVDLGGSTNTAAFVNSRFVANSAGGLVGGGGLHCLDNACTNSAFTNCTFHANTATSGDGGGIRAQGGPGPSLQNCVLWGNSDRGGMDTGAQIHPAFATPTVSYSIVQGGWSGAGSNNVNADPLFADANGADNIVGTTDDDLRISSGSPAADAGNNSALPSDTADLDGDGNTAEQIPFDLAGNTRRVDDPFTVDTGVGPAPVVDMGAYEFLASVLYVDASAVGADNGSSWINAFLDLQDALNYASTHPQISEIWVADGAYMPDGGRTPTGGSHINGTGVRTATFQLRNSLTIYGNFAGNETSLSQRNAAMYETILSGDLNGDDGPNFANYGENGYHVLTGTGTDTTAILDGLTVTGGNANYPGVDVPHYNGGGMICWTGGGSPSLRDCIFLRNSARIRGSGFFTYGSSLLERVEFRENRSETQDGSAMGVIIGSPMLTDCLFTGNISLGGGVGGTFNSDIGSPVLTRCRFLQNSCDISSSTGIHLNEGQLHVIASEFSGNMGGNGVAAVFGGMLNVENCTFSSNAMQAGNAAAIFVNSGTASVVNSIFWNNSAFGGSVNEGTQLRVQSGTLTVNHSTVHGWTGALGGTGNFGSDPLFVDANGDDNILGSVDDNLRLQAGSPAIDAGDNAAVTVATDLGGNPRIQDGDENGTATVDMGANEAFTDCNQNDLPDSTDIALGISQDCAGGNYWDPNLVPDECDIANCPEPGTCVGGADDGDPCSIGSECDSNYCAGPEVAGCQDCNLNNVPDGCDINDQTSLDGNADGIPDECGFFTGGCGPSINWSCVNNWNLPGDVYPDDVASAPGIFVTLEDSNEVFLDVNATMPGIRMRGGSTLNVTQSGSVGDLTINTIAGLSVRSEIRTLHNRIITIAGSLDLNADGSYRRDIGDSVCNDPVIEPFCGAAYGYRLNGGTLGEQSILTNANPQGEERFGYSVAVSGDVAVAGVPNEECADGGNGCGAAYVYQRIGNFWVKLARLVPSVPKTGQQFGHSVSISGEVIVIGAPYGDCALSWIKTCGQAHVFVKPGGGWTDMTETATLRDPAGLPFGNPVSIGNDVIVIGSNCSDYNICDPAAFVFVKPVGGWASTDNWHAKLTASDSGAATRFGQAISVNENGSVVVVGDPWQRCLSPNEANPCGAAYVFVRPAGGWANATQTAKLVSSPPSTQSAFGSDVAVSGDVVAVGLDHKPFGYVFVKPASGWIDMTQTGRLSSSDNQGIAGPVSISGDVALFGLPARPCAAGQACGAAYVYIKPAGGWGNITESAIITASDEQQWGRFGQSVDVSGNNLIVGAIGNDCLVGYEPNGVCSTLLTGTLDLHAGDTDDSPGTSGGLMELSDHMSASTTGQFALNGSSHRAPSGPMARSLGIAPPPRLSLTGDSILNVGGVLTMTAFAESTNSSSFGVYLAGDWDNRSIAPSLFDWAAGRLTMQGSQQQRFEVAGIDLGALPEGYDTDADAFSDTEHHSNFSIGTLEIAPGGDIVFENTFGNTLTAEACAEALYVKNLVLGFGSTTTLDNCRIYYQTLLQEPAATVILNGCGELTRVPFPQTPVADSSGIAKTRYISFAVPDAAMETALRVNLVSLHHVVPPYTGGASVPFTSFEGQVRWVGPPTQYMESSSNATPFYAATLQCAPHYRDWSTVGLLHVTGSAIVPSSIYEVENLAASCLGSEASCPAVSARLSVSTTRWADVEQPYNPPSPTAQPDVGDIAALVNKFRSASSAPIKARAMLAGDDAFGNFTTIHQDLGFGHIAVCVDAFRGKPYPHTIQACP